MATQPENPAAFPQPQFDEFGHAKDVEQPGMTLRDWFAGQVLAGLCANLNVTAGLSWLADEKARMAELCGQYADAMLVARATPTQVEKGGAE